MTTNINIPNIIYGYFIILDSLFERTGWKQGGTNA